MVVGLLIPALALMFRFVVAERIGVIIMSALVVHTAWHWMTERWGLLRQVEWPELTVSSALVGVRWLMAIVIVSALVWMVSGRMRRSRV